MWQLHAWSAGKMTAKIRSLEATLNIVDHYQRVSFTKGPVINYGLWKSNYMGVNFFGSLLWEFPLGSFILRYCRRLNWFPSKVCNSWTGPKNIELILCTTAQWKFTRCVLVGRLHYNIIYSSSPFSNKYRSSSIICWDTTPCEG